MDLRLIAAIGENYEVGNIQVPRCSLSVSDKAEVIANTAFGVFSVYMIVK
ncbi:MAG: hypothetical protein ACOC2U_05155 [bacterium]